MVPGKQYRPEDVLDIVWRHKWLIVVPFALIAAGTAAVAHFLPNLYRSQTLIQIVPQRVPESYVRSTITIRLEDRLQSLRQQILNRTRLERLIEDFNLYPDARQTMVMEDVVEGMRVSDIGLQIVKGDAFTVSYVNRDPRLAMAVTERLASMIIEENLRDREALAEGTSQFFETQLEDARRRLVEHEKTLEAYRKQFAFELPSQLESNLQVIQNAQIQVQALADSISRDRDRRLLLERQIADAEAAQFASAAAAPPPSGDPMAVAGATAAVRLDVATERLRLLELRLKAEHPDVAAMTRLVRDLEAAAAAEALAEPLSEEDPVRAPAEVGRWNRLREVRSEIERIDLDIARKESEQQRLREVVASYQARVDAAPTRESELIALMRDYETLQNIYTTLLTKKEDSNIAANLERRQIGEQFKVLDPARLPERPFSPNRTRIDLTGAVAGLLLGVGLAALVEYRDTSLRTDEDVLAALALPVVAAIPVMTSAAELRGARRRTLVVAAGATALAIGALAFVWTFESHMLFR